jgi:hypothetical protein
VVSNAPSDRVPTHAAGCQTERLGDETLVFCPAVAETIYLNDTAALVWGLCDGSRTVQQIVHLLRQAYPEDAARVAGDVEQTLRGLQERGAIRFA